ncbi:MAG TPA: pyridoxamine 5'-phosphate oxidase family protein [Roseiflexaceae bacterium]|nr:pyridoxamine 5'-phosphate oxidase family protein [Roseiflexaceae bacterium]
MTPSYHAGEQWVQRQAGVEEQARRVGQIIKSTIPPTAQAFLRQQPLVLVGSIDAGGQVWASLLTGNPGFLMPIDERTLRIAATPVFGDPLCDNLHDQAEIGLLAIDLASRRRMRLNGQVERLSDGSFAVRARQVYANCTKYIQARTLETIGTRLRTPDRIRRSDWLTAEQQLWVAHSDTLFIASAHPDGGADVSHRGGKPGFVRVVDARTLLVPDYAGNTMFQTLGNLQANPLVGVLLIDFARGATLQLTGTARIIWDPQRVAEFAGAERLVEVMVTQAIENADGHPFRSHTVEYSPYNPA